MAKTKTRYVKVKGKTKWGNEVTKWKDTKTGEILDYVPLGANIEKKGGELGISELPEDVKASVREKQKEWREPPETGGEGIIGGVLPDYDLLDQAVERQRAYEAELDAKNPDNKVLSSSIRGQLKANLSDQALSREGENGDGSGIVSKSDSDEVSEATLQEKMAGIQQAITDYYTAKGAAHGQKVLDKVGGQEYTTNFREAFRNANKTQVWEDTMDTDAPLEKSNVFTVDPATGLPLGVMTRNQRRAWDTANAKRLAQEAMDKNPEYQDPTDGSDTPKEWTTDDPVKEKSIGTQLGEGLTKDLNVSDKSNPEISFKPAKDNEDD